MIWEVTFESRFFSTRAPKVLILDSRRIEILRDTSGSVSGCLTAGRVPAASLTAGRVPAAEPDARHFWCVGQRESSQPVILSLNPWYKKNQHFLRPEAGRS